MKKEKTNTEIFEEVNDSIAKALLEQPFKEKTLKDKRFPKDGIVVTYFEKDVKEFIRKLKEDDYYELAKSLHVAYEKLSTIKGWNTQNKCKVRFEDLPEENKEVMKAIALFIIDRNNMKIKREAGEKLCN